MPLCLMSRFIAVTLSVIIPTVFKLSVIMLSVIMLSVIMLSVVTPKRAIVL